MADKSLQFYRGPQSGIPTLKEAEPGWTTDEKRLYVGDGTSNVAIANKSEVDAVQSDLDTLEGKYNQILADAATKTELATKQDKLTGSQGQVVGFDAEGNAVAQEAPPGLPEGGTQGQLLAKGASSAEWVDNPTLAFGPKTVATSAWASDSTYPDYPYRAAVPLSGVTANHAPIVNFSNADSLSGKLSPVADSYAGGVYIYATEALAETVNIGSVICVKVVGT